MNYDEEKWERYLCSYILNGAGWGVEIVAKSFDDCRERLRAIGTTGIVGGPIILKVSLAKPSWWQRIFSRT